uniref:S1 motif domain-containing protein n=1 Tax=Pyrodinium bahamense TaxID=73915 RepID=A0A7S0B9N2_9DINO|mmetsp:Transcript_6631/g.18098  ORF Transcript_6631/g.18098 Transcript_6631/m.18098 type:complete len:334 (+) Transcript_6631:63-1064(+)
MAAAWASAAAAGLAGSVTVGRWSGGNAAARAPEIAGLRAQLVCPGDLVTAEPGVLCGRGVLEREDGKLVATVCGMVEHVNKLLYVRPLKHRYVGSIGDVVVGRVVEVQTDRWAVEIGTAQLAYLHLGNIQLPGNEQRRRTGEDALRMRELLDKGDLISAEVLRVHETGELSLQSRSSRYGKLQNGVLAMLPAVCVRRQAQHLVTLPQGIMAVLGNNGWVWVCTPPKVAGSGRQETINFSQMDVRYEHVGPEQRERICRARNAVLALAARGLEVTPESIGFAYEESAKRGLAAWELLDAARCASAGLDAALVAEAVAESSKSRKRPAPSSSAPA